MKDGLDVQKEEYSLEIKMRAEYIFEFAMCIARIQQCLDNIRTGVRKLPVLNEQERCDNDQAITSFDKRMQRMVSATFDHMERYQTYRWQELFGYEEDADG